MRAVTAIVLQLLVEVRTSAGRQVEHVPEGLDRSRCAVILPWIAIRPQHVRCPEQANGTIVVAFEDERYGLLLSLGVLRVIVPLEAVSGRGEKAQILPAAI